jgi:tripartite ATP-independent transporter DctP family solute receptor
MKMLKTMITTAGAAVLGAIFATGALAQTEITFGHVGGPTSLFNVSAEHFAELANERLPDEYEVVVYHSSQLGNDTELLQKLRLGTVHFALPSTVMSSVADEFGLFELPYLVRDREHMKRIEEEIFWPSLHPIVEAQGYKVLAVWENGFRNITNNVRPIVTPEDLQGIKLRTPSGVWRVRMFEAYGASPSPMELSEVFMALQTGVMDGQENPLTQITGQRFQEVQKYLSLSGHVYTPAYVTAGAAFERLPEDVQEILTQAAKDTQDFVYETAARMDNELLDVVKEAGTEVNEVDKDAFVAASKSVYDLFAQEVEGAQDLIDKAVALGSAN